MICGIEAITTIGDYQNWSQHLPIDFAMQVAEKTGAIKEYHYKDVVTIRKTARYRDYFLELLHSTNHEGTITRLKIKGSIHRNAHGGTNCYPVTYDELHMEVKRLCTDLNILPEETILQNIEIGLPINFDIPVYQWLEENLICYSTGKKFNAFNKGSTGLSIGRVCNKLAQYDVKIYDSALKHGIANKYIMRFELHFKKMQRVNCYGIRNLADLLQLSKVAPLVNILTDAWRKVLCTDTDIRKSKLTSSEKKLFQDGDSDRYWAKLSKSNPEKYKKQRIRFKKLISEHGNDRHSLVSDALNITWTNSCNISPKLPVF